jgi:serine/threonine protein kinase
MAQAGQAVTPEMLCADCPELLSEIKRLLPRFAAVNDILALKRSEEKNPMIPPAPTALVPEAQSGMVLVGKYKLIERIGEGGMGSVWLALQTKPVKRQIAIKFIKRDDDTKGGLARFEAERQALALMHHPNIAKVLDGGTTETGQPFFAMEVVKGVPITKFCDARKLTLTQRMELFAPLCQAIHHAHQKGIIHRDIRSPQRRQFAFCLRLVDVLQREKGQVRLFEASFCFRGRPGRRKADSRPKAWAVCSCHPSSPYGAPRTTDRRSAASSLSVSAWLTYSTQRGGTGKGQSCNQGTPVAWQCCHKLDQRHCSARTTRLARSAFRST